MKAASTDSSIKTQPGTRGLAWTIALAAVLQLAAPVVTILGPGTSPGGGSGPELLITPAGWAFSIWAVIYALALAQAITVLVRGVVSVPRRVQIDQLVLYFGATAWILVAGFDTSLGTATVLLVMVLAAVDGILVTARATFGPRGPAILTRTSLGLYAGWVTAAFFLNVSTALVDAGPFDADQQPWQLVVLVIAAAALLAVIVAARGALAYAVAGAWALVGIAATAISDHNSAIAAMSMIGVVVLIGSATALRTGHHAQPQLG